MGIFVFQPRHCSQHIAPIFLLRMAPTIKFRAKNKGGNLVITVVSCTDLPDADAAGVGFGNKSDPYVVVRVGGEEQKTRALSGNLNPEFKKDTSTADDLIGKASIKLSEGQANGVLLSLALVVCHHITSIVIISYHVTI